MKTQPAVTHVPTQDEWTEHEDRVTTEMAIKAILNGKWESGDVDGDIYPINSRVSGVSFRMADAFSEHAQAHIVKAVNAHEELVAAIKAVQEGFRDRSIKWAKPRRSDSDPYHKANTLMCKAIAKAEGK